MTDTNIEWFDGAEAALEADAASTGAGTPRFRPIARLRLEGIKDRTRIERKLIDARLTEFNSMATLTGISGRWGGTTEAVRVYLGGAPGGRGLTWYYDLTSGIADIRAEIMVFGLLRPLAP